MSKPSQVIVLTEDRRQQTFVRRYLERANYSYHQIQLEPLPAGRGSGEQWVRQRYAKNVEAYRARAARAATALVVVIDADTRTVSHRIGQLRESAVRGTDEKISHLIPKRNIETWILCLRGNAVDEETDYHDEQGIEDQIKPAAETFFDWSRPNAGLSAHCVESLRLAIPEIQRLEG